MKKTLAVGAASVALAAMPIVGAFATSTSTTIVDSLSAKINSACVFTRTSATAGAASQVSETGEVAPAWTAGTGTAGTYSATFNPGKDIELGTSNFSGYCNDVAGFTVTVTTPALSTGGASPNTLPFLTATPSTSTSEGYAITKNKGVVSPDPNPESQYISGNFMSASAPTDSTSAVTATATYTVYTTSTTKSGTYTGDVTYTFTYDDPAA